MNVPVPKNRLVALTLFGVVLTGLVSMTLAAPNLLAGDDHRDVAPENSNALASDAPTPNENFTPAVQDSGGYEEHEEHEEEEYWEDEEHEDEEHEEEEDHD